MRRTMIALTAAVALVTGLGTAEAHHGRGSHADRSVRNDDGGRHGPPPWAPAHGWRAKHGGDEDTWREPERERRWRRAADGGWWHWHDDRDRWHWHERRNRDRSTWRETRNDDRWAWSDRFADWLGWR